MVWKYLQKTIMGT
jgi:transcriptional regulator with XRE-family HTH domain